MERSKHYTIITDGLTTLETRRLRGDQIKVFKILNGYENIDRNIFFTVKEERWTRGHGVTLAKKQCRLDIRKYSFSQRTVNEWNRLSADCVSPSTVNIYGVHFKPCLSFHSRHTLNEKM